MPSTSSPHPSNPRHPKLLTLTHTPCRPSSLHRQVAGLGGFGAFPGAFPGGLPAPFGLGGLSGNPAAINNFGAFGLGPFAQLSPANQKAADDKKKQEIKDLQDALKVST